MPRTCWVALAVVLLLGSAAPADESPAAVKTGQTPPPKELAEPVRALFAARSIQVPGADGPLCDLWLRTDLPVKEAPAGALKYRQLPETTLLAAVRFHKKWTDFRKQEVPPGVYTLRLAFQPMDGDHMGTAPYNEFLLVCPAKDDAKPATMDAKALHELSTKTGQGSHPKVLLLFPNPKPDPAPKLLDKGNDIRVLTCQAGGEKAVLGLGLTLFGHTSAE